MNNDVVAWYEAGLVQGIALGRQQMEDEWRGRHETSAAVARMIAAAGPWDELAKRRGEHQAAAEHRALLRRRGVSG